MPLLKPVDAFVSQKFAGAFSGEPEGWFVNATDGHPLKAYGSSFPGSLYHHDFHKGLDIYDAYGTPLAAMEAGKVTFRGDDGIGGLLIRVAIQGHPNVRYGFDHCSSFAVSLGATVKRGQTIAKMGKTGHATGVHAHTTLEIYEKASDGKSRWMYYDVARFMAAGSYHMGPDYGGDLVPGGSNAYDDRIYPVHDVVVNDGVNVRKLPDVTSDPPILLTTTPTTVSQINMVPGGVWTVGAITGHTWAKVKLSSGDVGYVATALISPA